LFSCIDEQGYNPGEMPGLTNPVRSLRTAAICFILKLVTAPEGEDGVAAAEAEPEQ
jgi:hypothetical protein